MFGVVLVGGFGTRLRPLTNDVPKPMLPVLHRPMIVGLIDHLANAGITDVVLALGFKSEPFQHAFPDGGHGDVRVHYAVEPEPLDTAGAIAYAARAAGIHDTFVVANGDIITDLDIGSLIDAHAQHAAEATIHLTSIDDPRSFGVVETAGDGAVERFVEKPEPGTTTSTLINAGTYVFEPSILAMVPPGERCSVERDVFPVLAERRSLYGYTTDDYWLDAGRPDQYLQANLDLVRGVRGSGVNGVHRGALVDPDAMVVESVIGDGAFIGGGARIEGSLILPLARVEAGAEVADSIVGGLVGSDAIVRSSVVASGASVRAGEIVDGERRPPVQ